MTEKTTPQSCDVTVTVSGDRGSGKSHLIAVLAQALRGAGHNATAPEGTPSALKAITDLSKPYNVTFVEGDPALREEAVAVLHDAADEITNLRADNAALTEKSERLSNTLDEFRAIIADLKKAAERAQIAAPALPSAEVERLITAAITHVRDATIIEQSRQDLNRKVEDLKSESSKLRNEAEARTREAGAMLRHALTGQRPAPVTSAALQVERRAAARTLSASEKLAIANGANPGILVAGDPNAQAAEDTEIGQHLAAAREVADTVSEATLASAIERSLTTAR